jgi:putative DNA methylase
MPTKKLIEVGLPLEAINRAAAREKSIRHGHPSTLHLWWARRPLAAARAVIFSQMVDDPGSVPEEFPTEATQAAERQRLFALLEKLVVWENTSNEAVIEACRKEVRRSWIRHLRAEGLPTNTPLPPFHDPFSGGGALPLEAQRLGLESHASDLNPVAVTINKAMIEIPPRFAGRPPVHPGQKEQLGYKGIEGLAEDVRYYGQWMRTEAEKRIGHLYPKVPSVRQADGRWRHATKMEIEQSPTKVEELTVIAWLWARTVASPNPAAKGVAVPLVSTFWLATKPGKEAWVNPVVTNGEAPDWRFEIGHGVPDNESVVDAGTKTGRGANFRCIISGAPIEPDYIKAEGMGHRLGARLMAVVCEGHRGRTYLPPTIELENIAASARPLATPDAPLPNDPRNFWTPSYGLSTFGDLFTSRQLVALETFSDLVKEVRETIRDQGTKAGCEDDGIPLAGGGTGATGYAEAVSVYLAFAVDRMSEYCSTICTWASNPQMEIVRGTFARQALPMTWDFAEANIFASSTGSYDIISGWIERALKSLPASGYGEAHQSDAASVNDIGVLTVISSDPPYYDNISYADLSDFFYIWLRRSLRSVFPEVFSTVLVPKAPELVATPYRHGGTDAAEAFFMDGMTRAIRQMATRGHPAFPVTIYYAFKQSEDDGEDGQSSTGWETFLEAVVRAGFAITGTWPVRTERSGRSVGIGTNVLASSIVLVCRSRNDDAPILTRREFVAALKQELPTALRHLQHCNIAPVDLAQASIGPGMAIYSRASKVIEADGSALRVRTALSLINQILDEVLAEQEGEFDPATRWAVAWFEQVGFASGDFGTAETLSKAKNVGIKHLVSDGFLQASDGQVRLLRPDELPKDWNPTADQRLTIWEVTHHLVRLFHVEGAGETATANLLRQLGSRADSARDLAYRLFSLAERRKHSAEAQGYNALVLGWPELARLAQAVQTPNEPTQGELI